MQPQWGRDFITSRGVTCQPTTIATYQQCVDAFAQWLGEQELADTVVVAYLLELKARGLAEETLRGRRRMLKTFCRWLVATERIDRDPFRTRASVPPIPRKRVRRLTYTDAQVIALLQAARPAAFNKRNAANTRERWAADGPLEREARSGRALILLIIDSAMRAGEVCALDCRDVRTDSEQLVITSKGGHRDLAFLTQPTREALRALAGDRPDDAPLFRDWFGERAQPRTLRSLLERLAERAGIEALPARPLHAFRHYAAQAWVKAGLNDLTIQNLMRHEQITTTQIYTRAIVNDPALGAIHQQASPVARLLTQSERAAE